jgi:hypothetical protein
MRATNRMACRPPLRLTAVPAPPMTCATTLKVRRNWKKRYFLLTDSAISYYAKNPRPPSNGEFKGRVSLGQIKCVVAADKDEKRSNVCLVRCSFFFQRFYLEL